MDYPSVRSRKNGSQESVQVAESYAVDLFDRTNQRSVINLLPAVTQAKIFTAARDNQELFRMPEKELRKKCKPTPTDNRLRLAFWNEYDNVQAHNRDHFNMSHVYAGVCTQQYFDNKYMNDPLNVAWMLCPPTNYVMALNEMLVTGQDRMREILDVSAVDEDTGEVNTKLGDLQHKIYLSIENRLKGSTLQRSEIRGEIKSLSVSMNASVSEEKAVEAVRKVQQIESMEEIEAKLARLRSKGSKDIQAETVKSPPGSENGGVVDGRDERDHSGE